MVVDVGFDFLEYVLDSGILVDTGLEFVLDSHSHPYHASTPIHHSHFHIAIAVAVVAHPLTHQELQTGPALYKHAGAPV
jgi:hypothetical protein